MKNRENIGKQLENRKNEENDKNANALKTVPVEIPAIGIETEREMDKIQKNVW